MNIYCLTPECQSRNVIKTSNYLKDFQNSKVIVDIITYEVIFLEDFLIFKKIIEET